ncbi:GYDIA family GHMP kinase [uncultured Kriegella sp.]|uniref:GYDIA family GHMP kinase n=1 Tax=uncultured Kriegella sp. TaxID=1798910 RepID=UPI0030DB2E8D|tara:strand:- start:7973 stop:8920 length:948 start_codon:yes stop_codon:yes gene_type:complete
MTQQFYSNGKLLLTGEYAVLDGALSLALPCRYGQSLNVTAHTKPEIQWTSKDDQGSIWFQSVFKLQPIKEKQSTLAKIKGLNEKEIVATAEMLIKILTEAQKLNPNFLSGKQGYSIDTKLDFPRKWGLGSSSTLINNVAKWSHTDAQMLLQRTFGGSGYDIACAQHNKPIQYLIEPKNNRPEVQIVDFDPPFKEQLYFVYLNKKQNSREGIAQYRKQKFDTPKLVAEISRLTQDITLCKDLGQFNIFIEAHEAILSNVLQIPTIKESHFSDFEGAVKSLGAWGGDFILATGNKKTPRYFKEKGYETIIPYSKMIL